MDAAEPARAHEADSGDAHRGERAADRGRAESTLGDARAEVPRADLPRLAPRLVEALQLVVGEADPQLPLDDPDRGRNRSGRPHAPLGLAPDGRALSGREAVRHERRLERDDGPAGAERLLDLGVEDGEGSHGVAPILPTQRAAASSAASGPATR